MSECKRCEAAERSMRNAYDMADHKDKLLREEMARNKDRDMRIAEAVYQAAIDSVFLAGDVYGPVLDKREIDLAKIIEEVDRFRRSGLRK